LMDIFTILVFFLLVNSSDDVEVLQKDKTVQLPNSFSAQKPQTNLLISINSSDILVAGNSVAKINGLKVEDTVIPGLLDELEYRAGEAGRLPEELQQEGRAITIMADKSLPYELLKKVMTTCAQTDYRNVSLAVNQVYRAIGKESE